MPLVWVATLTTTLGPAVTGLMLLALLGLALFGVGRWRQRRALVAEVTA